MGSQLKINTLFLMKLLITCQNFCDTTIRSGYRRKKLPLILTLHQSERLPRVPDSLVFRHNKVLMPVWKCIHLKGRWIYFGAIVNEVVCARGGKSVDLKFCDVSDNLMPFVIMTSAL